MVCHALLLLSLLSCVKEQKVLKKKSYWKETLTALIIGLGFFDVVSVSTCVTPRVRNTEGKVLGDCTVPVMCLICTTITLHEHSCQATNLNQNVYEKRRYLFAVIFNSIEACFTCFYCCECCFWNWYGDVQRSFLSNFIFGFFGCLLQGYVCCNRSCDCCTAGIPKLLRLKLSTKKWCGRHCRQRVCPSLLSCFQLLFSVKGEALKYFHPVSFAKIRGGWRVGALLMPLQRHREEGPVSALGSQQACASAQARLQGCPWPMQMGKDC